MNYRNVDRAVELLSAAVRARLTAPKNMAKGGWRNEPVPWLIRASQAECDEALEASRRGNRHDLYSELGDAGAYLAMALDVLYPEEGE